MRYATCLRIAPNHPHLPGNVFKLGQLLRRTFDLLPSHLRPGPCSDEVEMDVGDPDPVAAEANGYVGLLVTKSFGEDGDWRGPLYANADYTPSLMATAIHLAEWKVCHNVKTRGFDKLLKLLRGFCAAAAGDIDVYVEDTCREIVNTRSEEGALVVQNLVDKSPPALGKPTSEAPIGYIGERVMNSAGMHFLAREVERGRIDNTVVGTTCVSPFVRWLPHYVSYVDFRPLPVAHAFLFGVVKEFWEHVGTLPNRLTLIRAGLDPDVHYLPSWTKNRVGEFEAADDDEDDAQLRGRYDDSPPGAHGAAVEPGSTGAAATRPEYIKVLERYIEEASIQPNEQWRSRLEIDGINEHVRVHVDNCSASSFSSHVSKIQLDRRGAESAYGLAAVRTQRAQRA
eukprot:jgi/Tetstr1/433376/TSEL_022661.t1